MVDIQRTFTVKAPQATVVSYLRDFAHAEQWDPGTQSCSQIGGGDITVGTCWRNVSKLFGITTELTYRLVRDDPDHLVFEGTNKSATSVDDISIREAGNETSSITYHAKITFNSKAAPLINPIATAGFTYIGKKVEEDMRSTLENL
ncbi:SRPBCC family protein [Williamsia sterculiae]|uniref:Carbon monoxide dehydrogenase subunit G n=1 Tax=Williamsia sterculiae TaxID=1344003 RepID=A0A1N7HA69_9NOCA|nr:SRPBCC family protein [Williamsia sterculiae]SIS21661.1 Carbon monoxide dehydrogenase subunit G [Williamsia sterculiae]